MDITERLDMIGSGQHLDLADIVCADAVREIETLRKEVRRLTRLHPQVIKREAERLLGRR
jgi:hypothetical protein